jgi:hypothetical protein
MYEAEILFPVEARPARELRNDLLVLNPLSIDHHYQGMQQLAFPDAKGPRSEEGTGKAGGFDSKTRGTTV